MRGITRRDFLRTGAAATATALAGCAGSPPPAETQRSDEDVLAGDALDQAARVRSGEVTPAELVLATIRRIEARDGPINAVTTRFFERALREARETVRPLPPGPFRGVPLLLKDLDDLEGTPKSMGSRLFADYFSRRSSAHVASLVEAGFVVLGKTNTPEFGLVATTESAALGPCRNPWSLEHSTGGSSGGAAAAVAAGMLPLAQASDGGGSIRVPASCCGVFGLKPSRGRNRSDEPKRVVELSMKHCVSRSVRDTAAYSTLVQRRDPGAPFAPLPWVEGPSPKRLRIGFFTRNAYGREAEPAVRSALEGTAALCEALGHEVVAIEPDFEGEAFAEHFLDLWTSIPADLLDRVEAQGLDPTSVLEPVTIGMAERFRRAAPTRYRAPPASSRATRRASTVSSIATTCSSRPSCVDRRSGSASRPARSPTSRSSRRSSTTCRTRRCGTRRGIRRCRYRSPGAPTVCRSGASSSRSAATRRDCSRWPTSSRPRVRGRSGVRRCTRDSRGVSG
ncbi:MAG: amidase family protein [Myxococcota bacterium]